MMKIRPRYFLVVLTIALISLKLFPALDLYALKSLNNLFFDERTFAVITDIECIFYYGIYNSRSYCLFKFK